MGGSSPKQNTSSIAQSGSNSPLGLEAFGQGMNQMLQRNQQQDTSNSVPPMGMGGGLSGASRNPNSNTTMSQEKRNMYGGIAHPAVQKTTSMYDPANTGIGPSKDFLSAQQGYLNANPQKPIGGK